VATLGTQYVHFQATTFARLVTGQMDEFAGPEPGANRIEHHLKTVADKTASLIAASTRFGGMVAGVAPDVVEALTRFGEALGTVFQLSDDLLDVVSLTSGKTQGTDLREGVPTLVTLLIQENARPADGRLLELLSGPVAPDDLPEALALVRENPAVEEVRADIARRAGEARNELECLPDGPARQTLSALCDLVVTRSE
ncbi:MAG: polyprenyl synthetase family protein, partial [Propionibacteriaceae bacterium]|jgi:heptaprenyl diphosphate synthase|nr:polyprenyl synthetase family protein [Propionibacteriaceae bacterium]